jgi:hypothetical protein
MSLARCTSAVVMIGLAATLLAAPAHAQTDYYHLDKNRPTRVEDPFTAKQYAWELKFSPLTLAGLEDGGTSYRPEFELKYGLLPGFDVEVGASVPLAPLTGDIGAGNMELDVSALVNLTVETRFLPALGIRGSMHAVPASDHPLSFEIKGLATRTVANYLRLHLNGAVGLGEGRHEDWWAGAALDYVLPFDALLFVVSGYAARMNRDHFGEPADELRWHTDLGLRYQMTPTMALDTGIGRSWSGPGGDEWRLTLGFTHEFGVRALIPTRRR